MCSYGMIWIRISDPRSLRSWCIKGTNESTLVTESSLPLMHYDPSDLELLIPTQINPKVCTLWLTGHALALKKTLVVKFFNRRKTSNLWSLNPGRTNSYMPKISFQPYGGFDKDLLKWDLSVLSPWLLWLELTSKSYKGYNKEGVHVREKATVSLQPCVHLIPQHVTPVM